MKRAKILSASAGSGKTYQLAYKYVRDIVERPELYRGILAVTFTNKATEEMKSRILREIHILASGEASNYMTTLCIELGMSESAIRKQALRARTLILHDYSRFSVLTIDKFFQRIIRAFIKELGIDLNYNIELDHTALLSRSADRLVENIANNAELKRWMLEFVEDRISDGSRWDMRGDLRSLGDEIFKEGSRKRLELQKSKQELEAIVKKIKAEADSTKERLMSLGQRAVAIMEEHHVDADMFSGGSRSFAFRFQKYAEGEMLPPTNTMHKIADEIDGWYTKGADSKVRNAAVELQPILKKICEEYGDIAKAVNTAKILHNNYRSFALLADLSNYIDKICDEENIMILGNTKHILSSFVDGNNTPFIYEKVGNRFERFMIDEFQDTSVREWQNMLPLLENAMAQSEDCSVFIVGDVKQSIYRWRGGDWRLLQEVAINDMGRGNVAVERLEHNFRSLEKIISFNSDIIDAVVETDNQYLNNILTNAHNDNLIDESLHASLYDIIKTAYSNHRQKLGKKYADEGYAELMFYDTTFGDSPFIEAIEDAIKRGYKYRDILILVRGKSDGKRVAKQLFNYKKEKFTSQGLSGFNILTSDSLTIDNNDIVQFVISLFRLSVDSSNDIERGIYNRFLGKSLELKFNNDEQKFLTHIAHLSPMEAFEKIVARYSLYEHKDKIAYIQAMHEGIVSFSTSRIADIQHYLTWWEEKGCKETLSVEMTDDTIEISTIHKAKGLERDVVIIPYCNWDTSPQASLQPVVWSKANGGDAANIGEFPVIYNKDMQNSAFTSDYYSELVMSHVDAVNLLYVAITRASKELYMIVPTKLNTKSKPSSDITSIVPLLNIAANTYYPDAEKHSDVDGVHRIVHRCGTKLDMTHRKRDDIDHNIVLDSYISNLPNINIRYPSRRFTDEGMHYFNKSHRLGIMLHKVFESALTTADLNHNIQRLEKSGVVSSDEAIKLNESINKAMLNPVVSEWFSSCWDDVKCEVSILNSNESRRPDRVMISGRRAVIVDYKFGQNMSMDYDQQVRKYMQLLHEMGLYDQIEGYVWYVSLDKVTVISD